MTDIESRLQPDIAPAVDTDPLASEWARYLGAIAMTAAATVLAVAVDSKVSIPNLSLVFVIPVIVAGAGLGLGPSLCSAILGALAFNFFLTEPRYSLAVDDLSNIWAIGLLFVVGLIASGVAFTSRRRAGEAALLRTQTAVLQRYSRDIAAVESAEAVISTTCRAAASLFRVPAVVMLMAEGKVVSTTRVGNAETGEAELEAARAALATGSVMRGGVYPNAASRFDFWPVRTAGGRSAVVGFAFDPDERPAAPDALVEIAANILAVALDRQFGRE